MTDNRTTELREELTERGVEWKDESNGFADVTVFVVNGIKWTVISKSYLNPENDWMTMNAERITPEQAIAATLGSGTLTAEQVMAIAGRHQPDYCSDTHVCFDWQAIADELNELGSGTCELTETDSYSNANEVVHVLECSECGETRCPHSGRKVVSA